ncbi:MAG: hypothetical protein RLZZ353_127 [Actinomycetota bacterium]
MAAAGGPGASVEAVAAAAADDDVRGHVRAIALEEDPADAADPAMRGQAVRELVSRLLVRRLEGEEAELRSRLAAADAADDAAARSEALRGLQRLGDRRRALLRGPAEDDGAAEGP